jgi:3alpha(or 20beta)-hydroxysteroid dehydrogenase
MGRVDRRVVLISGGARGMGACHARLLVAEGARVMIGDLLDNEGKTLAAELGSSSAYVHLDVTRHGHWAAAVAQAVDRFGGLDVLVNNAGIASGAEITAFPIDAWNKTIAVNLTGAFLGIQAAVPALRKRRGASIINISSVEGLRGSAGLHAYVASKFGLRGLTKSVALDVAADGIRVNSVPPGFIATQMTADLDAASFPIPLGRGGQPHEVSQLVLFLASEESSYCTGAEFVIDGGLTIGVPNALQGARPLR